MSLLHPLTTKENPLLTQMNEQQRLAIMQTEGPLLVLAGAGSGKTRVVTHRIAYLIEEMGVAPWQILAITFTNKAARQMKERATTLTPFGSDVWISTFHSMCVSILRRYIDRLGYERNFVILDDADQISVLKQILKSLNIATKKIPPKHYAVRISDAKNHLLLPEMIRSDDYARDRIKEVYEKYQKVLKNNNRLDFDDLLMLTVHLFEQNPDVLEYYQHKFRYIHVDEYQDTNHAQYKIVKLLASYHRNICVVGDSDQSIYSWRGADITNILSFENDYAEAVVIKLEQNYRSTQNILDAANDVIKKNPAGYEKHLFSKLGDGFKIIAKLSYNGEAEVKYVASEIKKIVNTGISHEDIVILYRTNSQSRLFEQYFIKENIPYRLVGGLSFFKRKEIKDLMAFLRLILSPNDDFSFERIVNVPTRGIGLTTLEKVTLASINMATSMFNVIPVLAEGSSGAMVNKLLKFHQMIISLKTQMNQLNIPDFIDLVLDETGYMANLKAEDTIEANSRIENLEEFKAMAITFEEDQLNSIIAQEEIESEEMTTGRKLELLLTDIGLQTDVVAAEVSDEKITMMTIHSAKGLEFNTVFLVGFEDGIFPLYSAIKADGKVLEEERRLAYVAFTRAKQRLYLTYAKHRMHHGRKKRNKVSRFQQEISPSRLDMQVDNNEFKKGTSINKTGKTKTRRPMPKIPKTSTHMFSAGDKITHDEFGNGIVVKTSENHITIAFSFEHGVKGLPPTVIKHRDA